MKVDIPHELWWRRERLGLICNRECPLIKAGALDCRGGWCRRLLIIVTYWVLVLRVRPESFWVFPHQRKEVYLKKPGSSTGAEARRLESGSPVHPQLCPRVREVSGCLSISGKVLGNCKIGWNCQDNHFRALKVDPRQVKKKKNKQKAEMQLFMERWLHFQKEH